jgi:hypothetical protein
MPQMRALTTRNTNIEENAISYVISNPFYLYAPTYWQTYYSQYLAPALAIYDGSLNTKIGTATYTNQMLLPALATGISNRMFANGIDFVGDERTRYKMEEWAEETNLIKTLKKAYKFSMAGGTSLLKINRRSSDMNLYVSAHRIDTFFVDVTPSGEIRRARIFQRLLSSTVSETLETKQYMLVEERKYINGKPYVSEEVYVGSGSIQTETANRPHTLRDKPLAWTELPAEVRKIIVDRYPSVQLGKPIALPFVNDLGVYLWTWTEDNPRLADCPYGQPIGDILQNESIQFDQLKVFEKVEVNLARAKVAVPSEYMNPDDELQKEDALDETVYTQIPMGENGEIKPIQFNLRATDIKQQMENICKSIALKLNMSASSVASFISEGSGSKTATEIINEKTETDTFIKSQIRLVRSELNKMINVISRYNGNIGKTSIVFRYEMQTSPLETIKIMGDALNAGLVSPRRFVETAYPYLSINEKEREIAFIENALEERKQPQQNMPQEELRAINPQDYADVGGVKTKIS